MTSNPQAYSVVIPVFNAEPTLQELYSQLVKNLEPLGKSFEIILIDDCSQDGSWSTISNLVESDCRVKGVQLMRNSGQGAATMAGLSHAHGQFVVTMDDDMQNPPHEVPRLLRYLESHPEIDAVFGRPRLKRHGFWRRAGSQFINRLSNMMFNQDPEFKLTSFRAIRREIVIPLLRLNVSHPPIGALISTLTNRVVNIDVDHDERFAGQSGYSVRNLMKLTLSKFLGFSTFPLRLLAAIGILGIVACFLLTIYIAYRYLFGSITVPGWTTLTLLLIGISGFMFLAFGIIGEYLQQILVNTRRNPNFLVRSLEENEPAEHASAENEVAETSNQPTPGKAQR